MFIGVEGGGPLPSVVASTAEGKLSEGLGDLDDSRKSVEKEHAGEKGE